MADATEIATDRRLLDAAAELVAERGVGGVTVGEITKAAGQRNGAAVHYHFGGRDGLFDAIVREHHDLLDVQRSKRLDALSALPTIRDYVRIIVEPLMEFLHQPAGRAFLRIQADRFLDSTSGPMAASMRTVADGLAKLVPDADSATRIERTRLTSLMINVRLGQLAADAASEHDALEHDQLSNTLVDAVAAVLTGKET